MTLREKAGQLPLGPGVYLYKDEAGKVIYVGKAKSLRARVRSYFNEDRLADSKTGSLIAEARDIEVILVDNEKEALALENNLIKQWKPRFNILLRDDKTYPYIKLTNEKYPRVFVTRRLRKDGGTYFGPYFPANLAHRLVDFIHRHFKVPSCKLDFSRTYTHPCLQFHIHRCHGPCVKGLVTDDVYADAIRQTRMFLDGRLKDLKDQLHERMVAASESLEFERAGALRNLITTVDEVEQRQKMAAAEGDDVDIFSYHAEPPLVAVNLFHLRRGTIVDRREFFWEDQHEFDASSFFSSLLMQVYIDQSYIPSEIHVPVDFEDSVVLEEILTEQRRKKCAILTPQRGQKRQMLSLATTNAKHSFEQRFRVMKPTSKAISGAVQDTLNLESAPERIECFDTSHTQGTDKVASMVVWEKGRMKKADYRKFIIRTVFGNDDFASIHEAVTRRYSRLQAENAEMPGLVLIDGGLGQLHAAADALMRLGLSSQPLASIAKREETIYVYGQEDEPILLDRFHPVLHLIQMCRDEAHRFAVTFHRTRRNMRTLTTELEQVPGVGAKSIEKLLKVLGSVEMVKRASLEELTGVVGVASARKIQAHFTGAPPVEPLQ